LRIDDVDVQEQMLCLFSSTLEFNNLFCNFKGEGTGAVRHMIKYAGGVEMIAVPSLELAHSQE